MLRIDRLGLALLLKWWTIWFTLGRDFSRTSLLCVAAIGGASLGLLALLRSGAIGTSDGRLSGSLLSAAILLWLAQGVAEAWVLREGMRRMALRRWSWSRYDLGSYLLTHGLVVAYAAWRAV